MGLVRRGRHALAVASIALLAVPAAASGDFGPRRWYLDAVHRETAARLRLYDGRQLGVVMAKTPRPQLFMAWRLLHGRSVGRAAGETLLEDCCDRSQGGAFGSETAAWIAARALVPGAPPIPSYLPLDRKGPNYSYIPTCFRDAFDVAAAGLKDRLARYGADSPALRNWLAVQDAVFTGCATDGVTLPPPLPGAPPWLRADRAYQDAALALYDRRFGDAAARFEAIAHDATSTWQPWGTYLRARALFRAALDTPSPARFTLAKAALNTLAAKPAGTPGQGSVEGLRRAIAFREHPAALRTELEAELAAPVLLPTAARSFRDLADLASVAPPPSEPIDWMAAMKLAPLDYQKPNPLDTARAAALPHAVARWQATHDVAWLVAALTLTQARDPESGPLVAAAQTVPLDAPAGLSARYHLVRLTLTSAPADLSRARLDPVLARTDLSTTDRNLFRAQRMAVAESLPAFARLALRNLNCAPDEGNCYYRWPAQGKLDGFGNRGSVGLGVDAQAVIDRLSLAERIRLADEPSFAAPLQLDLALTSWARAVQLQDDAAIDELSRRLVRLLPAMAAQFARVAATPSDADKRFAEFLVLAKIPGIRTDFPDYRRPEGPVSQYQQYWTDWLILPRGVRVSVEPPSLHDYFVTGGGAYDAPNDATDLICLGLCGAGADPLRLPDFATGIAARAAAERGAFVFVKRDDAGKPASAGPAQAIAAWDEMLGYIARHPKDPRAAEALYWLVRVGHYGGSHNHSGRRAFVLLKARYGQTSWARRTRYFYD